MHTDTETSQNNLICHCCAYLLLNILMMAVTMGASISTERQMCVKRCDVGGLLKIYGIIHRLPLYIGLE